MTLDFSQEDFDAFLEEAEIHAAALESGVLALEDWVRRPGPGNPPGTHSPEFDKSAHDILGEMFRAAHSIKGAAGLLDLKAVARLTHAMENVLGALRNRQATWSAAVSQAVLGGTDALRALLAAGPDGTASDATAAAELALQAALAASVPTAGPTSRTLPTQADRVGPASVPAAPGSGQEAATGYSIAPEFLPLLDARAQVALDRLAAEKRYLFEIALNLTGCTWVDGDLDHPTLERLRALGNLVALLADPPLPPTDTPGPFAVSGRALFITTAEAALLRMLVSMQGDWLTVRFDPAAFDAPGSASVPPAPAANAPTPAPLDAPGSASVPPAPAANAPTPAPLDAPGSAGVPPAPGGNAIPPTPPAPQRPRAQAGSIRVGIERLDQLIDVVGELVIAQTRIGKLGADLAARHDSDPDAALLAAALDGVGRLMADLQRISMGLRMIPLERIFAVFPRQIRDLAISLDKEIALEIYGADTELDRNMVEALEAPLIHLLRNSADHGIEPPAERVSKGKPACGTIRLEAGREGGRIVIRVADDGAGIHPEKVLARARALGLNPEADQDVLQLLFQPGFSTAEQVSSVSGRGVGLDVVQQNIRKLKGSIQVESQPGAGATFTLKLPLTLAITKALLVRACGTTFALPVEAVRESIRLEATDVRTVNGREVIRLRESVLPLLRLPRLYRDEPEAGPARRLVAVIVEPGGEPYGLLVDALEGEQDIVIKPLGDLLAGVGGLTGGAILGDGRIALVVDPAMLGAVCAGAR